MTDRVEFDQDHHSCQRSSLCDERAFASLRIFNQPREQRRVRDKTQGKVPKKCRETSEYNECRDRIKRDEPEQKDQKESRRSERRQGEKRGASCSS